MSTIQVISCLGSVLGLTGLWLLSAKKWYGWLFGIATSLLYLYTNIVLQLWGFLPMNVIAIWIGIQAIRKWTKT